MVRTAYFNLFSVLMAVPTTVPTTVACEGAVAPGSKKCHLCRQVMFSGFRLANLLFLWRHINKVDTQVFMTLTPCVFSN